MSTPNPSGGKATRGGSSASKDPRADTVRPKDAIGTMVIFGLTPKGRKAA